MAQCDTTVRNRSTRWLNRSVLGIGLASLLSDWSHETITTLLPVFLAGFGAAAAWLGTIEGVADGISSFAKLASGYYTDKLPKRKPIAVAGYLLTAVCSGAIALASAAWHVLVFRALAWLGRGVRTPVRKALLAAAVTPETYGRAFGFERMLDTLGAIVGPATALALLPLLNHSYRALFVLAAIPGLFAALAIWLLVQEKARAPVPHVAFVHRLALLPKTYKQFLAGVALFGAGDFAHSMLILFAAKELGPVWGPDRAGAIAAGLYLLRNVFYAGFAFVAGWLADHFNKAALLATGYALGLLMVLLMLTGIASLTMLALIFVLAGIYIALEETLEDSLCAELVPQNQHGMGFGVLATVNGIGDLVSSVVVGLLWHWAGPRVAFLYSAALFAAGALIIFRLRRKIGHADAG